MPRLLRTPHSAAHVRRSLDAARRPGRRVALGVAALALAGSTACNGDGPTEPEPNDDVTGRYDIVEVRGHRGIDTVAPFLASDTTESGVRVRREILRGDVQLNANGTYVADYDFRETSNGNTRDVDAPPRGGTYTVGGDVVIFVADDDPTTTADDDVITRRSLGTIDGDTLTLTDSDDVVGELTIVLRK